MLQRYRIGVIGHTGRGNYGHGLDRVWAAIQSCDVVAVADPDPKGRADAANRTGARQAFADYRQMLDQVPLDIVAIAPRWIDQHRDMCVEAAERGIHIYLEKPMCRTPQEADDIVRACERHGVKLAIAFQTRYSPKLPIIRELIAEGAIGRLLEIRARGKEDHRGGGEDLWVLGSHLMNLIHVFAGEPQWCFASVLVHGRPATAADVVEGNEGIGPLVGDAVHAFWQMAGSVAAYFDSIRHARGRRFGLRLYGSEGVIELTTGYLPAAYWLPEPTWSPGRSGKRWIAISSNGPNKPEPLRDGGLHAGNILAVQDLIEAIENDRQPEANVYEARMTVEMIASVFQSHVLQRPVTLPLKHRGAFTELRWNPGQV